MRAIAIDAFGGPEQLKLRDLDEPACVPDGVIIAIKAAGVSYSDVKLRRGEFGKAIFPLQIGFEAAGVVERCGPKVKHLKAGDKVYAYLTRPSGYAERACLAEMFVARMPLSLGFTEAAALPLSATAADTAVEVANVEPGEKVFVAGGSGAVGALVIQLAKHAGAYVIASGGPGGEEYVRSLGADEYVDYSKGNAAEQVRARHPQGVDAAIDAVGDETVAETVKTVRSEGVLVLLSGAHPESDPTIQVREFSANASGERLAKIAQHVDAGKLELAVARTFPLEQAPAAHALVEARKTRGKVVLTI